MADEQNAPVSPADKALLSQIENEQHGPEFYDQAPGTGRPLIPQTGGAAAGRNAEEGSAPKEAAQDVSPAAE